MILWTAEPADSRLRGAVSMEPCWYEVTGLTEGERKAVHTGGQAVVCLSLVVVEQEEGEWLGIWSPGAQRMGSW